VIARLYTALACALMCGSAGQTAAQQMGKPQAAATLSTTTASVGNIDVRPRAGGIAIMVTAPVAPASSRASNPDRLIFDFAGCELKGGNRHIAVNRGPVKELRASLFSAHPATARIVVDATETLNFEVKQQGNGIVVIDIPFRKAGAESAGTPTNAATENQPSIASATPPKKPDISEQRSQPTKISTDENRKTALPKRANSSPGAYAMMEKAKALRVDDLQQLEDKSGAGDPEAQTMLALAYHAGVLLKKDDVEAARLLHKAADRQYMAAEESLGIFAETGIGLEHPAPGEALNWYKKAAEQGSVDAETDMALLYANGKGVARDPAQAAAWFRRAAEGGDASAQYNLALMYERGEGVGRDYKEAIRWFSAAGDHNLIPPLLALGETYLQPPSPEITTDVNKAIEYYQRAANLGSAVAEVTLGTIYSKGLTGKVDYSQAFGWYQKSASKGWPDGEFAVGVSYAMGHGVPVDYGQARRWLTAAANQGQIEAQYDLAIICEQGNGAPPDRELASHYYQMAAERGMAKAQYRYGVLLAKGTASADKIAAYRWLTLAETTVKESASALGDVKKNMSAQEIAEAEQDVAQWRSAHGTEKR